MARNAITARMAAFLLAALLVPLGAAAQPAGTAIDDLYRVGGIAVDIEAETAAQAREEALETAQRRALAVVLQRVALPEQTPDVAELEASTVAGLVQDLSISGERTSSVRYIAEIEVRLADARVRRFMAERDIGYSETPAAPVAVLPVFQDNRGKHLWGEGNPWLAAWQDAEIPAGLVPIRRPRPEQPAARALSAAMADRAGRSRYRAYADAHGAGAVMLAVAEETPRLAGPPQLDILLRRAADDLPANTDLFTLVRSEDGTRQEHLARAVARTVQEIRARWKRLTLVEAAARAQTTVHIDPSAATELVAWQQDLAAIAMVAEVTPEALSPGDVRLRLTHLGPRGRLERVLTRHGIGMLPADDGLWRLERRGTGMGRDDAAG